MGRSGRKRFERPFPLRYINDMRKLVLPPLFADPPPSPSSRPTARDAAREARALSARVKASLREPPPDKTVRMGERDTAAERRQAAAAARTAAKEAAKAAHPVGSAEEQAAAEQSSHRAYVEARYGRLPPPRRRG